MKSKSMTLLIPGWVAWVLMSGCSSLPRPVAQAELAGCRGPQHAVCTGIYPSRIERLDTGRCRCGTLASLH